jgi:hypothetical protein
MCDRSCGGNCMGLNNCCVVLVLVVGSFLFQHLGGFMSSIIFGV